MKIKKLFCIDTSSDYELIDTSLLSQLGIRPYFLLDDLSKKRCNQESVVVGSFSYEAILAACQVYEPDYIVSFSESLFVDLAIIREKLHISGMGLDTALLLSRKDCMYQKLHDSFPYPHTTVLNDASTFASIKEAVRSAEIFIKPVNASGSYETFHIKNLADFKEFLTSRKSPLSHYIAQAYVADDLYHSELVVYNGNIIAQEARKYSIPNHVMVSKQLPVFSLNIEDPRLYKRLIAASIEVCNLLGFTNGILHTEFFMGEDGTPKFVETNPRPPGIGLNKLYQKKYSISLETLLCCIVCGVKPPDLLIDKNYYACGYFPRKEGVVKKIHRPRVDVQNDWTVFVKENEAYEQSLQMSKAAMVLCWGDKMHDVNEAAVFLCGQNIIELSS